MYPIFEPHTKGSVDQQLHSFYTKKACRTFYQIQYFILATTWGYYVLLPTGWLPWQIGGDKSIDEAIDVSMYKTDPPMPYTKYPRKVLVYALSTMGYHFGDCVSQVFFKERQSDHYEMLLHHIVTCSLYFCMIYGNNMGLGCVIAYLHDIADIFGALVKCASSTKYGDLTLVIFFFMISTWFWTRLFILP